MTSAPPDVAVEQDVPLARLTTVGIGGPAAYVARPTTVDELQALLRWARETGIAVLPVGLGSNMLAADAGVAAVVVRLEGDLAAVSIDSEGLTAGGGAANAVCLHRARAAGLGGLEFACAIPGTAGGGVRMNAGAYGSEWVDVVDRALVVSAEGAEWRAREALGLGYRRSGLRAGELAAVVEFRLRPRPPDEIKASVRQLNAARKAAQPINRRTFGSVFKNPAHELGAGAMIERCGLKGHAVGGARFSPRHANFIENVDGASSSDALALMAEARRRVLDEFGVTLEREVELVGDIELPPVGERLT